MVSLTDAQICLYTLKTWARERAENRLTVTVIERNGSVTWEPAEHSTVHWYRQSERGESDEHRIHEVLCSIEEAIAVVVPSGRVEL